MDLLIQWKILEARVNVYWLYSFETMSRMLLIFSITLLICFSICGIECVKLHHSSLGNREDIIITHLITIVQPKVSTSPTVVIFSVAVWPKWLCTVCCQFHIYPVKTGFCFFITAQSCDVRKQSNTLWCDGRTMVCLHFTLPHFHNNADVHFM